VHSLSDEQRARLPEVVSEWYAGRSANEWEREEDNSERKKRLHEMGVLVQLGLEAFADDEAVSAGEAYGLLRRLLDEHAADTGCSGRSAAAGRRVMRTSEPRKTSAGQLFAR
jgi:hypothetical protein